MACLQGSMNSDGTGFIVLTIKRTRFKQAFRTYCFFLWSCKKVQSNSGLSLQLLNQGADRWGQGGPPDIWNNKKKCFFTKRIIKVCFSCSWECSGTFVPSLPHLRCACFPVVSEATLKANPGPLKGAESAQKALQGSETETR